MEENKRKAALKLLSDIKKKLDKWNERSSFTLKGVKNLSMSDLDTLQLYANTLLNYGYYAGLREPLGTTEEVLSKYGL